MRRQDALIDRLAAGWIAFGAIGLGAAALSAALPPGFDRSMILGAGAALLSVVGAALGVRTLLAWRGRRTLAAVMTLLQDERSPAFLTTPEGRVVAQNRAARARVGVTLDQGVDAALNGLLPDAAAVVGRLLKGAAEAGRRVEDRVAGRETLLVSCQPLPDAFLFRLDAAPVEGPVEHGDAFPMLSASAGGSVSSINDPMRSLLKPDARRLSDVFDPVPLRNGGVARLRGRDGDVMVRTLVSKRQDGRQDVFVAPVTEECDGRITLDSLPVALLRLDLDGRVIFSNNAARAILPQLDAEGPVALATLVEGLGRPAAAWLREAATSHAAELSEVVRIRGAEAETFLQITLCRALEDGGTGLIAVLSDATELKTMEAQFVQSQKMQAIGQLAGGVAHDFNNLLTAISGHCDLLLLRHEVGDEDHCDLLQITQNANRAAALVNQLLAFSRKQTLKMQEIDLRDAVSDLSHLLNRLVGERVRLVTEHDPALLPIRGDRRQLEQVLMNLVVNARDAMPEGGEVRIETGCRYLERPVRRDRVTVPAGQYVVVSVSDQGHGIPADLLPRIFEPFITTKRPGEGTGLGLSMVYGIVKQSGGFIFAESVPGRGARFEIFLPANRSRAPSAKSATVDDAPTVGLDPASVDWPEPGAQRATRADRPAAPDPEAAPTPRHRVLLVEDEAPVRAFAARALRMKGHDVIEAANAEEALATLEDAELKVDLFVTDVMMPGLDGPTWVTRALKARPGVPTVFMSGYAQDALERSSPELESAGFLAKPFSLADLSQTVERALEG